ncbi:MAG: M23 family metallopeptidase [Flavobacteriales bacterium]|nr:M23 family metallopeptidase [Flavobacteriales bacterium]
MSKRRKKIVRKLKREFRLSLLHEASYEERFSILLTPFNVILLIAGIVVVIGGITYAITALTPLREYVVPGYIDQQHRQDALDAKLKADSLEYRLKQQEAYLVNLQTILTGGVPSDSLLQQQAGGDASAELDYEISSQDSALRAQVEDEDRFVLRVSQSSAEEEGATTGFLFKPVEGTISSGYDADNDHYGIDLVAPENSVVKAVTDGTVILSSFTSDGGNVIAIQHKNEFISIYKHNSALYKEMGEQVRAGESIAVIGNTGDHSDGPHLHFELWHRGNPVDPLDYFIFEE